jgi:hypothetical protein
MQWSVQGQQLRAVNLHIIQNFTYTLACNVTCAALMFNACIGAAAAWAGTAPYQDYSNGGKSLSD